MLVEVNLHPIKLEERHLPAFASEQCQSLFDTYEGFYSRVGFEPPWIGYFILKRDEVAGCCGFAGKPHKGTVEVAYYTFKEFESQGIATAACRLLIQVAVSHDPFLTIKAKTAPEKNASTRILKKNGFEFSGTVRDHEIGNAWLWVLKKK